MSQKVTSPTSSITTPTIILSATLYDQDERPRLKTLITNPHPFHKRYQLGCCPLPIFRPTNTLTGNESHPSGM